MRHRAHAVSLGHTLLARRWDDGMVGTCNRWGLRQLGSCELVNPCRARSMAAPTRPSVRRACAARCRACRCASTTGSAGSGDGSAWSGVTVPRAWVQPGCPAALSKCCYQQHTITLLYCCCCCSSWLCPQVAPAKIDEACSKAAAGHYQLACAAAWEGKHGCACETGINHPNQARVQQAVTCLLGDCCPRIVCALCFTCQQSCWLHGCPAHAQCRSPSICSCPQRLQYYEESRKALGELQENSGAAAAASAAQQQLPKTPGGPDAGQQLQTVLGSNGHQPGSGPSKVQRTG